MVVAVFHHYSVCGGYGTDSDPLVILHSPNGLLVKVTPQGE